MPGVAAKQHDYSGKSVRSSEGNKHEGLNCSDCESSTAVFSSLANKCNYQGSSIKGLEFEIRYHSWTLYLTTSTTELFVPQRHHRVHLGGPASRDIASQQGNRKQKERCQTKSHPITRTDSIQHVSDPSNGPPGENKP